MVATTTTATAGSLRRAPARVVHYKASLAEDHLAAIASKETDVREADGHCNGEIPSIDDNKTSQPMEEENPKHLTSTTDSDADAVPVPVIAKSGKSVAAVPSGPPAYLSGRVNLYENTEHNPVLEVERMTGCSAQAQASAQSAATSVLPTDDELHKFRMIQQQIANDPTRCDWILRTIQLRDLLRIPQGEIGRRCGLKDTPISLILNRIYYGRQANIMQRLLTFCVDEHLNILSYLMAFAVKQVPAMSPSAMIARVREIITDMRPSKRLLEGEFTVETLHQWLKHDLQMPMEKRVEMDAAIICMLQPTTPELRPGAGDRSVKRNRILDHLAISHDSQACHTLVSGTLDSKKSKPRRESSTSSKNSKKGRSKKQELSQSTSSASSSEEEKPCSSSDLSQVSSSVGMDDDAQMSSLNSSQQSSFSSSDCSLTMSPFSFDNDTSLNDNNLSSSSSLGFGMTCLNLSMGSNTSNNAATTTAAAAPSITPPPIDHQNERRAARLERREARRTARSPISQDRKRIVTGRRTRLASSSTE